MALVPSYLFARSAIAAPACMSTSTCAGPGVLVDPYDHRNNQNAITITLGEAGAVSFRS
jgi:hypothetical protein